jgi:hypothetical protein
MKVRTATKQVGKRRQLIQSSAYHYSPRKYRSNAKVSNTQIAEPMDLEIRTYNACRIPLLAHIGTPDDIPEASNTFLREILGR